MYAYSHIKPYISTLNSISLMISSNLLASHILPLILFHLLLATELISSARILTATKQEGHRVTLTRTNYYSGTWNNNPSASPIQYLLKAQNDLYIMTLDIGIPPVTLSGVMDTGSDLIWTKCYNSTGLDSFFDPSKSMTFSLVYKSCDFFGLDESCIQHYDDGLSVKVTLGKEILFLGNTQNFKGITFGCGQPDKGKYDGIIGMGRRELSLISQLNERVFSYGLGSRSDGETSGVLLTGSKARSEYIDVQTTPLIEQEDESYYYISLQGISVGETRLSVTNSDFAIEDGGMIIDSGTTFTYLEQRIIDMISNEFMNQTNLEKSTDATLYDGLEHCFMYQGYNKDQAPIMVFHFEDVDWELPGENYIYEKQDGEGGCLAFMATNSDDNKSIFGNMMQQNMMVIYDLDNNILSFKPAICTEY
ncbi:aspartic proteinase nepenthesin-1-like [Bidens hawaiensis]|uniref:aspartic proteinase nepenthesin-1-like n=1 Tax=Bidens hawaiensis TaxID=980011 RepID=UPI0040495929